MRTLFSYTLIGSLLLIGAIVCLVGCDTSHQQRRAERQAERQQQAERQRQAERQAEELRERQRAFMNLYDVISARQVAPDGRGGTQVIRFGTSRTEIGRLFDNLNAEKLNAQCVEIRPLSSGDGIERWECTCCGNMAITLHYSILAVVGKAKRGF